MSVCENSGPHDPSLEHGFSSGPVRPEAQAGRGGARAAGAQLAEPRGLSLSGRFSAAGLPASLSQFHLKGKLCPLGLADAVVSDAEEPWGEARGGRQQGDAREEQHALAARGLLLLRVQAQKADPAGAREGAGPARA